MPMTAVSSLQFSFPALTITDPTDQVATAPPRRGMTGITKTIIKDNRFNWTIPLFTFKAKHQGQNCPTATQVRFPQASGAY